ncbi:MAG: M13 family metallopeptidase [Bacteroidota bacterium]|nr:M13 family metallopeptidase [Bacteroidota bacterium]
MKKIHFISFLMLSFLFAGTVLMAQEKTKGDFLTKAIDPSIKPGDDFYKYATGTWVKNNPIPSSESAWGVGNLVQEETYARIKTILAEASKSNSSKGSNKQKVGDFYFAGMDTVSIEKLGLKPLKSELDLINSVKNKKDLYKAIATLQKEGVNLVFGVFVDQDAMNSDRYSIYLWQDGLGLPNRDYYFRNDARTENIRNEYKKHLSNMLALLKDKNLSPEKDAAIVYKIESFLADSSRKLEDLRDPYKNYNKMTLNELSAISSNIDWKVILTGEGIKDFDYIVVGQPEFVKQINAAFNKFSIPEWKAYMKWQLVNSFANCLGSSFEQERFHFRGTVISGIKEQRPRWKRIQDATEGQLGELLGQVYVQKYYSAETKKRYEKLVDNIIDAFRERLQKLDWMSAQTKEKAIAKLNAITKKVGYPDKWKDFSKLSVDKNTYVRNVINANKFWSDYSINKLGKPVDRLEWNMTPQTYNAYYNPSNNEIVLPAAMFIIPGVPDSLLDDAIIYSYAGASTIGHELTHGFDDQGRQYDAKGNLSNWWTEDDEKNFNARTKPMIDQFNNFICLDSMHINGEATVGENIADLGGLVIGLDAFMKTQQYKDGKEINGLTPLQRFWLGYAYSWLDDIRPESLARQIMTDVHSPAFLRVNGPLSNIPEFYKAFNIQDGDKMYRQEKDRVKIW